MQSLHTSQHKKRFFYGLGLFIFSGSTVAFVTDPFLMADMALVILGIYLMVSALMPQKFRAW
jgi:hypothetical protein